MRIKDLAYKALTLSDWIAKDHSTNGTGKCTVQELVNTVASNLAATESSTTTDILTAETYYRANVSWAYAVRIGPVIQISVAFSTLTEIPFEASGKVGDTIMLGQLKTEYSPRFTVYGDFVGGSGAYGGKVEILGNGKINVSRSDQNGAAFSIPIGTSITVTATYIYKLGY